MRISGTIQVPVTLSSDIPDQLSTWLDEVLVPVLVSKVLDALGRPPLGSKPVIPVAAEARPGTGPVSKERLLYSKREAAAMLSISMRSVDNLISLKRMPVRRIGRRVLIPGSALRSMTRVDSRTQRSGSQT